MLSIVSAVLFFIAFLINAADISTNDTFTSTNIMLIGLAVLALHLAGLGSGWRVRGRRPRSASGQRGDLVVGVLDAKLGQ